MFTFFVELKIIFPRENSLKQSETVFSIWLYLIPTAFTVQTQDQQRFLKACFRKSGQIKRERKSA